MGNKIPRAWGYLLILLILAVGAVLVGKGMLGSKNDPGGVAPLLEEKTRELEEKERQIQGLDNQIAQLRKELEESSKRVAGLQTRLEETTKVLSSTQQGLKRAMQEAERQAATPPQLSQKVTPKPIEPAPPSIWRRPAEPGTYEVIQTTSVFDEPSGSSRKVATINGGTKVAVVRSVGEWLEVRSKYGNPPGFIRRDDAMFIEKKD